MERTLRIETLVHGGDGLARDEGRVVFVPLVAEGDLVRVNVEDRAGVRRGELLEVLEPGPSRIAPPCPLVGTCGGCDRQQVARQAQETAKFEAIRDALARIGGLPDAPLSPLVPSPKAFRYRRRVRAQLIGDGWGFQKRQSHAVVRVPSCLLVEEEVEAFANAFAPALKKAALGPVEAFQVDVTAGVGAAHVMLKETPTPVLQSRASRLLREVKGLRGLVLTGGTATQAATVGDPVLIDAEHRRLRVRPDLFTQANRLGARLMAEHVAGTVSAGASVLELFAGAGTLTLAIAERAGKLVATEGEGPSLGLLRASLGENKREARLIGGPAKRVAEGLAGEGVTFDHVVLDPPRVGAKETLPALIKLAPQRITYVSCDPATFARDAGQLVKAGWALAAVTPFDLFPQTHHVELVAVFERA
jgi:23S rRNA (uracil1939-C5)-methyltransferase